MAKRAFEHTPVTLKKLTPPDTGVRRVTVGGVAGLELQISATNARSWILRGTFRGKRVNRGLGAVGDLSLAEAREEARRIRQAWREGRDPAAEREAALAAVRAAEAKLVTFAAYYPEVVRTVTAELAPKSHTQWMSSLEAYAVPSLGGLPVASITPDDVAKALKPIWGAKADTAGKVRGRIERICEHAIAAGIRTNANPASVGLIKALLGDPRKVVEHQPSLYHPDAPAFYGLLRERDATSYAVLRFLMLTCVRSGEARHATWGEFDLNECVWRIPPERTKTRTLYRVPLTEAAVAQLPAKGDPEAYVFPNTRGGPLTDAAVSKSMRVIATDRFLDQDTGRTAVVHGLRATFRSWAQDVGADREIAELVLGHMTGDAAERAYKRSDVLEARRTLLKEWSVYLGAAS